jgi:hypothetical protein
MDQNRRAGGAEALYGQGLPPNIDLESKTLRILALIFSHLAGKVCPIVKNRDKNDGKLGKWFNEPTPETTPRTLQRIQKKKISLILPCNITNDYSKGLVCGF